MRSRRSYPRSSSSEDLNIDRLEWFLTRLMNNGTEYFLDGLDRPCFRNPKDPIRKEWLLCGESGRPSLRARAFLRSEYRRETENKEHLSEPDLRLTLDYLVEEAFKAGGNSNRTEARGDGDYNFEAVVVFASTMTQTTPGVTRDAKTGKLVYHTKTAELWHEINAPAIEVQVRAPKRTFYKALNFFSRRLTELKDQFPKEGLEVTVTHKEDGSWVTIVRDDQICYPGPVLVTPDGETPSSSALSSGSKVHNGKRLERTDATHMEIEDPKQESIS